MRLSLVDPWRIAASLVVLTRTSNDGVWREQPLEPNGGTYVADLSATASEGVWYAEARDRGGQTLATLGSAAEPRRFSMAPVEVAVPPPPAAPSNARRVAAWTIAGVAVAAAVSGAVVWAVSSATERQARKERWDDTGREVHARAVEQQGFAVGLFVGAGAAAGAAVVLFTF